MRKSNAVRESIPEEFKSFDEAADFWDSHDMADYWDQTKEVTVEVDLQRRVFLTALEPELAKELSQWVRRQGISTETLVNLWLREKLAAAGDEKRSHR